MADTKLAKVGITVKESWKDDISYEVLDYVLWRVQDGGDGCGYIAKRANIGVVPNSDDSVWIKATQAGQSIYDLAVKYGHFVGTEEDFEAEYQAALQAARGAASETSATNAEIQEAEELRKTAENARVEAETARQTAESARQTAETARETAESGRQTAEAQRSENETTRQSQETARQAAEQTRLSNETARESAEQERTADFEALKTDMETAIGEADAATAAASEINRTIQQNETARQTAEGGRVSAETQRQSNEEQRGTNESTRQTAEQTRNTQETDRQAAEGQRATAEQGRASAESSRVSAEQSRVTAETARDEQSTSDHQLAESDHATAAGDHTQAIADHQVLSGYDTRLTNTETEVRQLGKYVENPEYIRVITDENDRFLAGITPAGETKFAKGALVDKEVADSTEIIEDELFLRAEVDADGKLLSGTKKDGSHYIRNVESETIPDEFEVFTDKENRLEVVTDVAGRIVSQRLPDGKLEEMVGVKTPKIELPSEGLSDLAAALKGIGAIKVMDWSDEEFVQIPIPRTCAVINIQTAAQAETKTADIDTVMEFWDKDGNYFKKAIILNSQGSSSMSYAIKNQSIDLNDGSEIKFGSWMPFDSFHLKKYFIDVFRGQCVVGYHLAEQIYQTRPYGERRPWDYINHTDSISSGKGSFAKDFDTEALGHPDGFPVKVFFNGKNAGVYAFCIKKARGNYYCKKSKQDQILLDGVLGDPFFTANGNMAATGETGATLWNDFEIRNPKINKDINGNPYDGDAPTEPSNDFATCKANIARLTEAIPAVQAASSTAAKREKFEEYFNVPFVIDYDIIGNVLYHYDGYRKNWLWLTNDGEIWAPMVYDLDSIFGQHWNGASYVAESTTEILGTSDNLPTGLLKTLYQSEMRSRYAELRRGGVITVENIVGLLTDWVSRIGYDNLKDDIENVVVANYVEGGVIMPDKVPNTPSYRDGSLTYTAEPATGGWYNSAERVKNWLTARIATLDAYFNYNV